MAIRAGNSVGMKELEVENRFFRNVFSKSTLLHGVSAVHAICAMLSCVSINLKCCNDEEDDNCHVGKEAKEIALVK